MKYVSYDNLKRTGSIIVRIEDGMVIEVYKPAFLKEWNGDVIILDYDIQNGNEEDDSYTEITKLDGRKTHCYYSVW